MDSEQKPGWEYKGTGSAATAEDNNATNVSGGSARGGSGSITWTALEYIDHNNGFGWYALLVLATAAIAAAIYLLTKDKIAAATVIFIGLIIGAAALRRPQQISYELSPDGIKIGQKSYGHSSFKSFYLFHEGELHSISLTPLKKFMPPILVYFDPADEEKIIDILSSYLPYEEHKVDKIERLSRRLRF
jgi:hypothetical protein